MKCKLIYWIFGKVTIPFSVAVFQKLNLEKNNLVSSFRSILTVGQKHMSTFECSELKCIKHALKAGICAII